MYTICEAANIVLNEAEPIRKARTTIMLAEKTICSSLPKKKQDHFIADFPARPRHPLLLSPRRMPKRRGAGIRGRIALIHSLAHIELNAIDMAWDMIARYSYECWPPRFYKDWLNIAKEEAEHFCMLEFRLKQLGAWYGKLPAHNGMWDMVSTTKYDALARLALVPMVLEARGLDVTPGLIKKFNDSGDKESVQILNIIYRQEIGHVATGFDWFKHLCHKRRIPVIQTWQSLVKKHYKAGLKKPFNINAREKCGMNRLLYEDFPKS